MITYKAPMPNFTALDFIIFKSKLNYQTPKTTMKNLRKLEKEN